MKMIVYIKHYGMIAISILCFWCNPVAALNALEFLFK